MITPPVSLQMSSLWSNHYHVVTVVSHHVQGLGDYDATVYLYLHLSVASHLKLVGSHYRCYLLQFFDFDLA